MDAICLPRTLGFRPLSSGLLSIRQYRPASRFPPPSPIRPHGSGQEPWINLELVSRALAGSQRWRRKGLSHVPVKPVRSFAMFPGPGVTRHAVASRCSNAWPGPRY